MAILPVFNVCAPAKSPTNNKSVHQRYLSADNANVDEHEWLSNIYFVVLSGMRNWFEVGCSDAASAMAELQRQSFVVNTVMTSPPYFGKRHYGGDDAQEIGKEDDVDNYLANLTRVFNAVPLHPLGSVWVNLGDTRDGNGSMRMVPERFALAMQACGWHLVDNIIWAKVEISDDGSAEGHCMVEPAAKRINGNGYEYLYRFTKCSPKKAWADPWAVMLPRLNVEAVRYLPRELMRCESSTTGRGLPNVWRVQLERSLHKHYAPYPTALCERPIAMTCPLSVCSKCGTIRTRQVDSQPYDEANKGRASRIFGKYTSDTVPNLVKVTKRRDAGRHYIARMPVTVGWSECECKQWERGIVLDPFVGSGTTGEVALKMGRSFIGIDLYSDHYEMAEQRCAATLAWLEANKLDAALLEK